MTSRLRVEEKWLLQALNRPGIELVRWNDGDRVFDLAAQAQSVDGVFNRSLAYGRCLYATRILEAQGVPSVNTADVVATAGDKLQTNLALDRRGVPNLRTLVAFTPEAALNACETLGYPVVLKPVVGSWGRLVARLDSRSAAEAILEDRAVLGNWQHQIFYLQEYADKGGRDARAFVVGDECVAAIWRRSDHWITNTARGASVERADHEGELGQLALDAARAIGGGILAVDIVETPDGLRVLEVNHSAEFRNSVEPTGVDLPGAMADYVVRTVAAQQQTVEVGA